MVLLARAVEARHPTYASNKQQAHFEPLAALQKVRRGAMTNIEFAKLVERAKGLKMSSGDREEQRRSFAYGNANIENSAVTRAVIDEVAERMAKEPGLSNLMPEPKTR
jgi:hypothetical protein